MKTVFFEGNAFTGMDEKPLDQEAIGNPALICFSEKLPADHEMSDIARLAESPMTAFIAPMQNMPDYAVRYYSPNGLEVDLCGHATLVSTYFLKNHIANSEKYNFNPNPAFLSGGRIIRGLAENREVGIQTNFYKSQPIDLKDNMSVLTRALGIKDSDIVEIYNTELNDFVFILRNNNAVRYALPNFDDIIAIGNDFLPHRTMVLSAESGEPGFDYEARVFAPGIGVNEDIACGSVNCSLGPVWAKILNTKKLMMFYCKANEQGQIIVGGVQKIEISSSALTICSNVRPKWNHSIEHPDYASLFASSDFKALMQKVSRAPEVRTGHGFIELTRKHHELEHSVC